MLLAEDDAASVAGVEAVVREEAVVEEEDVVEEVEVVAPVAATEVEVEVASQQWADVVETGSHIQVHVQTPAL